VSLIGPSGCGKSTLLKVLAVSFRRARATLPSRDSRRGKRPKSNDWSRISGCGRCCLESAIENAAFLLQTADKSISRKQATERAANDARPVWTCRRGTQATLATFRRNAPARGDRARPCARSGSAAEWTSHLVPLMPSPRGNEQILLDIWERTARRSCSSPFDRRGGVLVARSPRHGRHPGRIIETLPIALSHPRTEESFGRARFYLGEAHLRRLLTKVNGRSTYASPDHGRGVALICALRAIAEIVPTLSLTAGSVAECVFKRSRSCATTPGSDELAASAKKQRPSNRFSDLRRAGWSGLVCARDRAL